jgi:hypothetical protein
VKTTLENIYECDPETNLGWPPLLYKIIQNIVDFDQMLHKQKPLLEKYLFGQKLIFIGP